MKSMMDQDKIESRHKNGNVKMGRGFQAARSYLFETCHLFSTHMFICSSAIL